MQSLVAHTFVPQKGRCNVTSSSVILYRLLLQYTRTPVQYTHTYTRTYTSVIALGTLAQPPSNCTITTHLARRARNQKTVHQALRVALYCAFGLRLALSLSAPWKKPLPSMLAIHGAAICCCCLTLGKYLL